MSSYLVSVKHNYFFRAVSGVQEALAKTCSHVLMSVTFLSLLKNPPLGPNKCMPLPPPPKKMQLFPVPSQLNVLRVIASFLFCPLEPLMLYIRRVQPTRCNVSQFIYFCKKLYMFQTVFPSITRSSNYLLPAAISR